MEVLQDTYKDTKIVRIPKDWDVMMLNEITNYKSSNLSLNKLEENTGKYKLYGASGMLKGIDFYQTDKESFAIVKDGSGFGNLLWCDENSSILGTLGRITNKEISDLKFCFYLTHTINFKRYMSGSTIPHLYYKDYGNIKLPVPPLPEQQKIAAILSTVDEQICTTDKIIEKSKELKKGLMQKLFSEGIGHTEFKDTKIGRIPKDWEVVKLVDLIKLSSGKGLSKKNMIDGNIPVYGGNGISGYHNDYFIEEPTIVIGRVGEYCGSIHLLNENCWITDNGLYVTKFLSEVNLGFLAPLFQIMNFNSYSKVGGQPSISQTTVTNLSIPFPPLPEQQKIADILSEADAKIEKEQEQKAQLEQLKKGLMQQLLTGKKRVKV